MKWNNLIAVIVVILSIALVVACCVFLWGKIDSFWSALDVVLTYLACDILLNTIMKLWATVEDVLKKN